MRSFLILIAAISFLLVSCKTGNKQPPGLIPQAKMKKVLWDMMRADQFMTDFVFSRDTALNKLNESLKIYHRIFEINQVSQSDFQQTFKYYQDHPNLLKALMDSVSNMPAAPMVNPVKDSTPPVPTPPVSPARRDSPPQLKVVPGN